MNVSSVTSKGQVVIPVELRRKYKIKEGSKVAFIERNKKIELKPVDEDYFRKLSGALGLKGKMLKSLMRDKKIERSL
jgi:AbrB family looped-hinge helix DNA binding protein